MLLCILIKVLNYSLGRHAIYLHLREEYSLDFALFKSHRFLFFIITIVHWRFRVVVVVVVAIVIVVAVVILSHPSSFLQPSNSSDISVHVSLYPCTVHIKRCNRKTHTTLN